MVYYTLCLGSANCQKSDEKLTFLKEAVHLKG